MPRPRPDRPGDLPIEHEFGPKRMRNESELEQMINLLALSAEIMRKLAKVQKGEHQEFISLLAEDIEGVADKLVDALYPFGSPRQ